MNFSAFIAVGVGASLGAWCRWGLAQWLNSWHPRLPLGTLVANIVGGLLIGAFVGWSIRSPELDAWRPFVVTGVLGALTTFSTFSAESLSLLQRGEIGWALLHGGAHLLGSIAAAGIGFHFAMR